MSKKSEVVVKTVMVFDVFGKGKHGVIWCGVEWTFINDLIEEIVDKQCKEIIIRQKTMVLEDYVNFNYDNITNKEKELLENQYKVRISYYNCEDN